MNGTLNNILIIILDLDFATPDLQSNDSILPLSCQKTFAFDNKNPSSLTNSSHVASYLMITRCPRSYGVQEVIRGCESDVTEFIADNIPVIMTKGNAVIFKNWYCLICHGSTSQEAVTPFEARLTFSSDGNIDDILAGLLTAEHLRHLTVTAILDKVKSQEFVFKTVLPERTVPNETLSRPCGVQEGITEVSYENCVAKEALDTCHTFYLPLEMVDAISGTSTVFKNVACSFCVASRMSVIRIKSPFQGDAFNERCFPTSSRILRIQINLSPALSFMKTADNTLAYLHLLPNYVSYQPCPMGYFRDFYKVRLCFCPLPLSLSCNPTCTYMILWYLLSFKL